MSDDSIIVQGQPVAVGACGKLRYRRRKDAEQAEAAMAGQPWRRARPYRYPVCNGWHLTTDRDE